MSGEIDINVFSVSAFLDTIRGNRTFSVPTLLIISRQISEIDRSWPALGVNSIIGLISGSMQADKAW